MVRADTSAIDKKRKAFDLEVECLAARLVCHLRQQIDMCEELGQTLTQKEIDGFAKSLATLQEIGRKTIESQSKSASRQKSDVVLPMLPRRA